MTVISEGRVIYSGPTATMLAYFEQLGFACPPQTNPADFCLDLVSVDYSSVEAEHDSKERIARLADQFHCTATTDLVVAAATTTTITETAGRHRPSLSRLLHSVNNNRRKFCTLLQRAWRNVVRDKQLNVARLMSNLFSALLFGAIYFQLGNGASTVPDRFVCCCKVLYLF